MNMTTGGSKTLSLSSDEEDIIELIGQVPFGRITTTKALAKALNLTPNRVSSAVTKGMDLLCDLPAHRVLCNNYPFGYKVPSGRKIPRREELLASEGIELDSSGVMVRRVVRIAKGDENAIVERQDNCALGTPEQTFIDPLSDEALLLDQHGKACTVSGPDSLNKTNCNQPGRQEIGMAISEDEFWDDFDMSDILSFRVLRDPRVR